MKLSAQVSEKMRDSSHIWAPPIYRRLLSFDKRERDMSERCLLKIKSTILPPPLVLSKVLTCLCCSPYISSSSVEVQ
jgi:telomere-associated protein RIF1